MSGQATSSKANGSDHGAHAAFSKAESPASVKKAAQGSTKYKHR